MKLINLSVITSLVCASASRAIYHGLEQAPIATEPLHLLELAGGKPVWVTEAEKWDLKRAGQFFMDVTEFQDLGTYHSHTSQLSQKDKFPKKLAFQDDIKPLLKNLEKSNIKQHLEHFTLFHNRFYASPHGAASSKWLFHLVEETISKTGAFEYGITIKPFEHSYAQHSIIVTIPGQSNSTIVIGAHQDSINHAFPMTGRAPGGDDDGSGTMTILEVLRVLLGSKEVLEGKSENTIEFHWYAAEEGGLLGSQAIWKEYEKEGRDVKAMLQQDMTGFIHLTVEAGKKPEFGLMTEVMDEELMDYMKLIIEEYTEIGWISTTCGPRCGSDHMSAMKAGFPAVFIIEAEFKLCDDHLHGIDDLTKYLNYDHMIDHAQMSLGYLYELAFAKL